jgi:DMSO/TMAO reductase YedYZ molybdopterin-dependent catalytic subunit
MHTEADVEGAEEGRADQPSLVVVKHEPFNAETPAWALTHRLTPSAAFYVRSNYPEPQLPPTHALDIAGAVESPLTLSLARLSGLPQHRVTVTLECAGNGRTDMRPLPTGEPWKHHALGTAEWTGVPLVEVLSRARLLPEAVEVLVEGADGDARRHFARSLPREKALHPDTLLALGMNGRPLPRAHGGPVRLVVPGWYGMASVKWVARLEALTRPFEGYYQRERYVYDWGDGRAPEPVTRMRVRALILAPEEDARVAPGPVLVQGVAWSGERRVARVEVSVDGAEPWAPARLLEAPQPSAWVRWAYSWEGAAPGRHTLRARATDEAGETQPLAPPWNRLGYGNNAVQTRVVEVAAG